MRTLCLLTLLLGLLTGPSLQAQPYQEQYRPQFHFSPAQNWMNDPNGLVYFDGEYHLFYQYNPFGDRWGHMSWGHAVSPDMVHWEHLPVALPETDSMMVFSGSAVVDHQNTSGFGTGAKPPMVAIYTAHYTTEERQSQYIAYSTDRGRMWTPYKDNPVIDLGMADFRDPKVSWYAPEEKWVMVVALPTERKVQFYASENLKKWTFLSDFGPAGSVEGIWECPDLFELPVEGTDETRWVLEVDLGTGAPAGGSGGQYFIGDFNGTRFTSIDSPPIPTRWVDYGADYYAAVSWSDVPASDGRRLWLGWMNNWAYAQDIPTSPWRSAQSLPRALVLGQFADGLRLVQRPVDELKQLRGAHMMLKDLALDAGDHPLDLTGKTLEIKAEFEMGTATSAGLKVRVGNGEETLIGYDTEAGEVFVDRSRSGESGFDETFDRRHAAPLAVENGRVKLHLFVDWSSVEVFADEGQVVLTERIFPAPESDGLALFAEGGQARLLSLEAWTLHATWTR